MAGKKPSFEQAVSRLEEIVTALERGEAPLDESLSLFEEGAGLMKLCSEQLSKAEQKVSRLMVTENGEVVEAPLEDGP
jgi:exodeoxyribonuclease VII small subunit